MAFNLSILLLGYWKEINTNAALAAACPTQQQLMSTWRLVNQSLGSNKT